MTPPKSILVTRLDGLGDIVLSTGLLLGLHQLWPYAGITMLLRRRSVRVPLSVARLRRKLSGGHSGPPAIE